MASSAEVCSELGSCKMAMLCGQAAKLCGHHLRLCSNFVIFLNQSANKLTSPTSPHLTLLRHFSSTLQDIDVECSERNWLQELLAWNILLSDAVDNLCKLTLLTSSASTWHMSKSIERSIEHSFSLKLPFLQELRKMRNTLLEALLFFAFQLLPRVYITHGP